MYGMINKITAVPGEREQLLSLLLRGSSNMRGCLSYIVSADIADPNVIWVTEAWDTEESHKASLSDPAVRDVIATARPLIAGFERVALTQPRGGRGLGA